MSQMEGHSETIDGHTYTVYMLSPKLSRRLLVTVAKMVGPAIGPVLDGAGKGGLSGLLGQELTSDFFTKAATQLCERLDNDTIDTVFDTMSEVSQVDGKSLRDIFEIHFRGRLDSMFKWLAFAMKIQWGNSLSALIATSSDQSAQVAELMSQSQRKSTG